MRSPSLEVVFHLFKILKIVFSSTWLDLPMLQSKLSWFPACSLLVRADAGNKSEDQTDIFVNQFRIVLEFWVPVWNAGLNQEQVTEIECVKKSFLQIALGCNYTDYNSALEEANLEKLSIRRTKLCKNIATKAFKHPKHSQWFVTREPGPNTRSEQEVFKPPLSRLSRLKKVPYIIWKVYWITLGVNLHDL